jgi:hypothetical protein
MPAKQRGKRRLIAQAHETRQQLPIRRLLMS